MIAGAGGILPLMIRRIMISKDVMKIIWMMDEYGDYDDTYDGYMDCGDAWGIIEQSG